MTGQLTDEQMTGQLTDELKPGPGLLTDGQMAGLLTDNRSVSARSMLLIPEQVPKNIKKLQRNVLLVYFLPQINEIQFCRHVHGQVIEGQQAHSQAKALKLEKQKINLWRRQQVNQRYFFLLSINLQNFPSRPLETSLIPKKSFKN